VFDNGRSRLLPLRRSIQAIISCFRRAINHNRRHPETIQRSSKLVTYILLCGYMSMSAQLCLFHYASSSTSSDLPSTQGSASLQLTVCHRFLGVCVDRLTKSISYSWEIYIVCLFALRYIIYGTLLMIFLIFVKEALIIGAHIRMYGKCI
jgi:hypothetical protein